MIPDCIDDLSTDSSVKEFPHSPAESFRQPTYKHNGYVKTRKPGFAVKSEKTNPEKAATKLKTELCNDFLKGMCRRGDNCNFAHGEHELKKKKDTFTRFKCSRCESYNMAPYYCEYGSRCQFAHLERHFEVGAPNVSY